MPEYRLSGATKKIIGFSGRIQPKDPDALTDDLINNINTLCRKNGMEIVFYDKSLPSNDRSIEAYGDVLQKCDAVIFNGEGSLHDGAAINMFENAA